MKRYKKISYRSIVLGTSLLLLLSLLSGCGSKETQKETTASSIKTESTEVKDPDSGENHNITLDNPFQKNIPQYVCDGDDPNRRVKAIIIPYGDTEDEIKVTTYEDGEVDKSYIVQYKIKKVTDGDKEHLPIYQYSFYNSKKHFWRNFDVTLTKFNDIKGQVFLRMIELDGTDKAYTAENKTEDELRKEINSGKGCTLYDDKTVVSMK